jgi:glycosyltransferase involved in cell wall biosynthesis
MAKILSVVWYQILPARFGGQKGIAEFNEYLSRHHVLHCLCSRNNDPAQASYQVMPELPLARRQVANPANWFRIIRKIRETKAEHLILEHCYYGLAGMWAKKSTGVRLIVHAHNIEATRFREIGKWWWSLLWLLEKFTFRSANLILFKTPEDMEFAIDRFGVAAERCMLVPYGLTRDTIPAENDRRAAAASIRKQYDIAPDEKIILFSGTLDYAPNANALALIVDTLIPMLVSMTDRPFRVIACGRILDPSYHGLLELNHHHYTYAGLVENLQPYLLGADIFINPVSEGGGIKVKTMEALSYNLPVVSTTHSARGINPALTGEKLRVAEDGDWHRFCRLILESWDDQGNTPEAFFREYHWSGIVRPFAEKLNTL